MNICGNKGLFLCASVTLMMLVGVTIANAQTVPQIHRDLHRTLQEQQDEAQNFRVMFDSLTSIDDTEDIFELFPALDLYGSWDNTSVNPLAGKKDVVIPEERDIDVSKFYPPTIGRITSNYGWRRRRMHRGIDLKLYVGDTVRAAFDGQVRIKKFQRRGYGYYYVLRHPNGLETVYGHLSKFIVDQDDYVKAGQAIGLGGNTGRSTGSHLHFETRFMGIDIDPSTIIDFETFKPKNDIYHFSKKVAKSASAGKSSSKTSSGKSSGSSGKVSGDINASYHIIKKGDTLGAIARHYGTTVSRLCQLNNIKSTSILSLGQKIKLK